MLNWTIFDRTHEYLITCSIKETPLVIKYRILLCDGVFMKRAKLAIIHDKNDKYTPVMIDVYLQTFISASRPNKGNKKKKDNIQYKKQCGDHQH